MGVSGSGKSTVGSLLAQELNWRFADADDHHSPANVEKMRSGIPLTDADRAPWLDSLRALISGWIARDEDAVLACSALKKGYREMLKVSGQVNFVYLKANRDLLARRLSARHGHYMKPDMLDSQFEALEEPKDAFIVDAGQTPQKIVREIRSALRLTQDP